MESNARSSIFSDFGELLEGILSEPFLQNGGSSITYMSRSI
jgi:hypothetical protein